MEIVLREKVEFVDRIIKGMNTSKEGSLIDILKAEIKKLQKLNQEYESVLKRKTVARKEESPGKTKYSLQDGSVYVVNRKRRYKYLYDAATGIITYEFETGQVERTFPGGIKEIRFPDGRVVVKTGEKDYDVLT